MNKEKAGGAYSSARSFGGKEMNIYRRAEELVERTRRSMTDEELFTSPEYSEYIHGKAVNIITGTFHNLRSMGYTVTRRDEDALLEKLSTDPVWEEADGSAAYTVWTPDGSRRICINAAARPVSRFPSREEKHLAILGLLYHETGHILFTDFSVMKEHLEALEKGKWYPSIPKRNNGIPARDMSDGRIRRILCSCAGRIDNCLEDGFVEMMMARLCPARGRTAISHVNSALLDSSQDLDKALADGQGAFERILDQTLLYSKFSLMKTGRYDGGYMDILDEIKGIIDPVRGDTVPARRKEAVNEILCLLYPLIRKDTEEKKEELVKKGLTEDEAMDTALSILAERMDKGGVKYSRRHEMNRAAPAVMVSPDAAGSVRAASRTPGTGSADENRDLELLAGDVSGRLSVRKAHREMIRRMKEEGEVDMSVFGFSDLMKLDIRREEAPLPDADKRYRETQRLVEDAADALCRTLTAGWKEKKRRGKERGLYFGRRLEANSLYRDDGKYFSKNALPDTDPTLAVGVLADESGSTRGELMDRTRLTALVLEKVCRKLDIPVYINGYSTAEKGPAVFSYCEGRDPDGMDHLRIMSMKDRIGTPTVAALGYFLKKMNALPEKRKLVFVITDGRSGDNDMLPDGSTRIERMVEWCAGNGIVLIAAGIGDDRIRVEREFSDRFMDISDPSRMHEMLGDILIEQFKKG